jgi:hypothetical protein
VGNGGQIYAERLHVGLRPGWQLVPADRD